MAARPNDQPAPTRSWIRRCVVVCLYAALLALTIETACRMLLSLSFVTERAAADTDVGWRRRWLQRHRRSMEMAYQFDVHDATKGWVSKPNLRNFRAFGDERVNTNSRGLRGTTEYSYEPPADRTRVLALGDSFTFGDEVSDGETYTDQLQTLLPHAEIINMGVHGYGHDQMLILFEEEGVKYRPDVVVLGFLRTDIERNVLRFRDYAKPRFILDGGGLVLAGSPVPAPEEIMEWDAARPAVLDMTSLLVQRFRAATGLRQKEELALTAQLLNRLVAKAEEIGAVPIVAYFPSRWDVRHAEPVTAGERIFFAFCDANARMRCVSLRPDFRAAATTPSHLFTERSHWSPEGNRVAAEAIARYLRREVAEIRDRSAR